MEKKMFWFVVYNRTTGDFSRAWGEGADEILATESFEASHKEQVIHVGEGIVHPKTYRSLKTV